MLESLAKGVRDHPGDPLWKVKSHKGMIGNELASSRQQLLTVSCWQQWRVA